MPPTAVAPKPTVLSLAEDLAAGRTTSRALIEAALTRIADTAGEGARTFIKVYSDTARAAALRSPQSAICRCATRPKRRCWSTTIRNPGNFGRRL